MIDHRSPRIVLVTGATTGIGRFIALDLAARGHRVFATGRNPGALAELGSEASGRKLPLTVAELDVTSTESIARLAATIRAQTAGHGVDVVINNAGYGQGGALLDLSDETLRAQFETNVFGLMAVTRAFTPEMIARGRGWIVNVSSVGGRVTFPFFGAYHASKYAVEALSDALRAELHPLGVRVSLVEPGPIRSEFSERAFGSLPASDGSSYAGSYALAGGIRTATDRASFGPEHVARAVRLAIGSRFPRARYVAPWFLAMPLALLPLVPTRVLDALFRRAFGLRRTAPAQLQRATSALLGVIALALGLTVSARADAASGWETLRNQDGITVSRRDVPGSPFVALRGEGDVDAPLLTVGSVLVDVARDHEWIDDIVEAHVLRRVSETEYVVYSHLGTPPTMSDRDFVVDVRISADAPSRTIAVRMHSVDDPAAPKTDYVRADLEESSFVLTANADGTKTHVVAEMHADPRGSIAAWIVNLFQKNWGYNTIANLRKQLRKPGIGVSAPLQSLLASRGFSP